MSASASAQSQPASRDTTDTKDRSSDQPNPQPPINITVTTPQPSVEATKREEQYREREVGAEEDVRDFTRWLTYLTFIQATFGFVGLFLTWKATKAAERAASIAEQALTHAERAYLDFSGWTNDEPVVGKPPSVKFHVRNNGRTPCWLLGISAGCAYGTVPPTVPEMKEVQPGRVHMTTGFAMNKQVNLFPVLDEHLMGALNNGSLWVYLEASYEVRGFESPRTVRICMRFDGEQRKFVAAPQANYDYAD